MNVKFQWGFRFPRFSLTCVQPLTELFDLIGGARLPVDALCVEAVHLDVVDEFLHQLRHHPLLAG